MPNLTWSDLIIERIAPEDTKVWLQYWKPWIQGRVAPLFMSKFGDWFLRRTDGGTDELSVIEGTYNRIASTPEEFAKLVKSQEWQEEHLLSWHVLQLHNKGLIPNPGQCYGFAPHPTFTGRIDTAHAMIMDIGVWQTICAQTFLGSP